MHEISVGAVAGVWWEFPVFGADTVGGVTGGHAGGAGGGGGSVPVVEITISGGVGGVCERIDMSSVDSGGPVGGAGGLDG